MLAETQQPEFDTGPRNVDLGGERLCVATRKVKPVAELLRFVVAPDGQIVPDLKRKLPGRGIWVTATRKALTDAVRRNAFGRGFDRKVAIPADLADMTERLLQRSALDALAITGKAGQIVTGFSKVEASLARGHVVALLHAADAAPDGVRKIGAIGRESEEEGRKIPVVSAFNSAQLNLALGRPNVVHAALLAGPASETFLARCARLERFRAGEPCE
jgi:predicted RNA-binding protein YlxR (DUF448 family)